MMDRKQGISGELKDLLYENGAALVGFADVSDMVKNDMVYGVSVAVTISPEIIQSIHNGPNMEYFNTYHALNEKLDVLITKGAEFLNSNGYKAYAQTTKVTKQDEEFRTALPHKSFATKAGLGWIGKSALFVTKQFGSAIRLSSLVTNAELSCGEPITTSICGDCMLCTNACPGNAISGKNWRADMDRSELFNPYACEKKAREIANEKIDKIITLCGKCIEVCPYTQNYVKTYKK